MATFKGVLILHFSALFAIGALAGCDNKPPKDEIASECSDGVEGYFEQFTPSASGAVSPKIKAEWKKDLVARCVRLGGWDEATKGLGKILESWNKGGSVDSGAIAQLKKGHAETCIPNISDQLETSGLNYSSESVRSYCACLADFYWDGASTEEVKSLTKGVIPKRISDGRYDAQGRCLEAHLRTP
jgi:hypothetical protein